MRGAESMYDQPVDLVVGFLAVTWYPASLAWPDPIPRRGVIAFSISAPLGKGSGTLHSAHSYPSQRISLSVD